MKVFNPSHTGLKYNIAIIHHAILRSVEVLDYDKTYFEVLGTPALYVSANGYTRDIWDSIDYQLRNNL